MNIGSLIHNKGCKIDDYIFISEIIRKKNIVLNVNNDERK